MNQSDFLISTVVTPANSLSLVSVEEAKDELGIRNSDDTTDDGLIGRYIARASDAVNSHCNRVFVRQSYRDSYRLASWCGAYSFGWRKPLLLSHFPIAVDDGDPVLAVTEDAVAVDAAEWLVNINAGQLYRLDSAGAYSQWTASAIVVDYDAGYDEIPGDVKDAVLRLVTMRYKGRGRDPMLMTQDQAGGVGSQRWWVGGPPNMTGGLPEEIAGLLEKYRVFLIG